MTSDWIELGKPCIGETDIIDVAFDFLLEGRSISECRARLLSEYEIDPDDLSPLLEKAMDQVAGWKTEVSRRLRF
jgi:hypothetical protein